MGPSRPRLGVWEALEEPLPQPDEPGAEAEAGVELPQPVPEAQAAEAVAEVPQLQGPEPVRAEERPSDAELQVPPEREQPESERREPLQPHKQPVQ